MSQGYELNEDPQETEVEITEDEAVMKAGRMTVRVDLKDFKITYEADGKVLTKHRIPQSWLYAI